MEHIIEFTDGGRMIRDIIFTTKGGFLSVERDRATGHYVVRCMDAVAMLIYVPKLDSVIMISQSRPAAVRPDNPKGTVIEMPAGLFDRDIGVRGLVVAEAYEETGVVAREDEVILLNNEKPLYLSTGKLTERIYLAFLSVDITQVEEKDRVFGKEDEGEKITRMFVPVADLPHMQFDNAISMALVYWFLDYLRRTQGRNI